MKWSLLRHGLKKLTTSRAGAGSRVRAAGRGVLDHEFDASSPIPFLPDDLYDAITDHEVVLPPRRLLTWGNQSTEGLVFLASLVKGASAGAVFEIGTFNGATTWTLSRNRRQAIVHTLDLPKDDRPRLRIEDRDRAFRSGHTELVYEELGAPGQIVQHWSDSAVFDFSPLAGRIGLVYVDGAHSREYVEVDSENALTILSELGAIVWDDYSRRWPGVRDVLDERRDMPLYRVPHTRMVVYLTPKLLQALNRPKRPRKRRQTKDF